MPLKNKAKGRRPKVGHTIIDNGALAKELYEKYQLSIVEMASDGNCMFRALSHQLRDDPSYHMDLRVQVMDYIAARKDHFQAFLDEDEEDWEKYIERMRTFGEWGDHMQLYAAAQCLNINIVIHQHNFPRYVIQAPQQSTRTVQLSFHGDCHYNSVVAASGSSAVEATLTQAAYKEATSSAAADQKAIDRVARSVPWMSDEMIVKALERCQQNIDEAIDLLCTQAETLTISSKEEFVETKVEDTAKLATDGKSTRKVKKNGNNKAADADDRGNPPTKTVCNVPITKVGVAKLSKKEKRKLEKHKKSAQDDKPPEQIINHLAVCREAVII